MSETNLMTLFPSTNEPPWTLRLARKIKIDSHGIRLISWLDIWTAVSSAERHGNLQIVELFLIKLFEEGVFDDEGAWSVPNTARPHKTEESAASSLLH
jgi:hypothetical protein